MPLSNCDVHQATHVVPEGCTQPEKIAEKWGIGPNGEVAKPSEGGFGVVTESGRRVDMWHARRYMRETP